MSHAPFKYFDVGHSPAPIFLLQMQLPFLCMEMREASISHRALVSCLSRMIAVVVHAAVLLTVGQLLFCFHAVCQNRSG